jgi:signal peptidase II
VTEADSPEAVPERGSAARPAGQGRALRLFAVTGVLVLLVDLGTKHLALQLLETREPARLLGGAVYLTLVRNSGAAFSMGSDFTFVFPVVALCVLGWIGWLLRRLGSGPWGLALGLIVGGVLGNLADRLFRAPGPFLGHVVDMISVFDERGGVFPVFNVADSALTIGVALAILLELTGRQRDGGRLPRPARDRPGGPAHAGS